MTFFDTASCRITDWLVRGGGAAEKDRTIYEFGLNKLFSMLTCLIMTIVFSLLFGVLLRLALVFFSFYFALRVYAGGYHAETQLRCFYISIAVLIPPMIAIRYCRSWYSTQLFIALLLACVLVVVVMAPVAHKNRSYDETETVVFRRRVLIYVTAELVACLLLLWRNQVEYSVAALCGMMLTAFMVLAGKMKQILAR